MASSWLDRTIAVTALLSLIHCAYSAAQHRFYLRLIEEPFSQLPLDIVIQTIVSLVALIYGAGGVAGSFQPIRADLQNRRRTWDEVGSCLSFATFDHRAKALSPSHAALRQQQREEEEEEETAPCTSGASEDLPTFLTPYSIRSASTPAPQQFSQPPTKKGSPDFTHLPGARMPKTRPQHGSGRVLEISNAQAISAFDHCVSLVRTHDFDNYAAALLFPRHAQPEAFAVLALNVELAHVRNKVAADHKSTTGIYRLQFWKDALDAIYGERTAPVPRQPIAVALCAFAPKASSKLLGDLVSARQKTIGDKQFSSVSEACEYGDQTWGNVIRLLAASITRPHQLALSPLTNEACAHLGTAFTISNMIRSALPLLSRGIILLPSDLLLLHNVTPDRLYNQKQKEESKAIIRDLAKVSENRLQKSRALCGDIPREIRTAFLSSAASTDHILRILANVDYSLFDPRLQRRNPLQPWTLMWRRLCGTF